MYMQNRSYTLNLCSSLLINNVVFLYLPLQLIPVQFGSQLHCELDMGDLFFDIRDPHAILITVE
jgi:hypothetical protein